MALSDIGREAVLSAIAEYDRLGEHRFLKTYGFERSRSYWLVYNGSDYVSKAIVGAAHQYTQPGATALKARDFGGGKSTVQRLLENLGFHIEFGVSPDRRLVHLISPLEAHTNEFDPANVTDARTYIAREIAQRRGQQAFRNALRNAYEDRCSISGCSILDVLEAAHIFPYRGEETNAVSNGLLLRADLHTLFDCGLLAIDPDTLAILLAPALRDSEYGVLAEAELRLPRELSHRPNREALRAHRSAVNF